MVRTLGYGLVGVAMSAALAHAAPRDVVSTPTAAGFALARQTVPATAQVGLARSRIIHLVRGGIELRPGDNDARAHTSTIVTHPLTIAAWTPTPELWDETVACLRTTFARFAVTITEDDPGDTPHMKAVFGGSPVDLGLARGIAGISPFTTDCAIVENSVVFAFTAILPKDARTVCQVMTHEIAHSYGLDHELLETDPMTIRHTKMDRQFADQEVACGEDEARACGAEGSTCRVNQNSYALLAQRLGLIEDTPLPAMDGSDPGDDESGGCAAGGGGGLAGVLLGLAVLVTRRGRRARSARPE